MTDNGYLRRIDPAFCLQMIQGARRAPGPSRDAPPCISRRRTAVISGADTLGVSIGPVGIQVFIMKAGRSIAPINDLPHGEEFIWICRIEELGIPVVDQEEARSGLGTAVRDYDDRMYLSLSLRRAECDFDESAGGAAIKRIRDFADHLGSESGRLSNGSDPIDVLPEQLEGFRAQAVLPLFLGRDQGAIHVPEWIWQRGLAGSRGRNKRKMEERGESDHRAEPGNAGLDLVIGRQAVRSVGRGNRGEDSQSMDTGGV